MIASPLEAMVRINTADLTPCQRRVLICLADGLDNREVGERLGISERTVKHHISGLLSRLHVASRTQAALFGSLAQFCADTLESGDAVPVQAAAGVPGEPVFVLAEEEPPDVRWSWDEAELQAVRERLWRRPWRDPIPGVDDLEEEADDPEALDPGTGHWAVFPGGVRRWVDGAA